MVYIKHICIDRPLRVSIYRMSMKWAALGVWKKSRRTKKSLPFCYSYFCNS